MSQARRLGLGPARQGALAGTRLGRDRARRFPLASPTEHEHDRTVVFALCSALLLLLFDRGANLRHDIGAEPVPRQNLIRLGQERRDPSIRPQAKTPSLVGGRATGIVRPSALHGHTGVAMEDGEQVGWAAELDLGRVFDGCPF